MSYTLFLYYFLHTLHIIRLDSKWCSDTIVADGQICPLLTSFWKGNKIISVGIYKWLIIWNKNNILY